MIEQRAVTTKSDVAQPLLSVRDLKVAFPSEAGRVEAVRGVSFDLHRGKTLGIVGESGSGKSVTSMAIMGLLPEYASVTGEITLRDRNILDLDDRAMSKVRGRHIGMIFQDPLSSLTPIFSIGSQIVEALQIHQDISSAAAWKRAVELLDLVGIPNPDRRAKGFPHEFSGGMRQRAVIAMAIANDPDLIIADEPTTALDVTVQAQILDVLKTAQRETGAAVIMITHDLGVVAGSADDVMVMYAGRPVERAGVDTLFSRPRMPYTIGLMGAIPRLDDSDRNALTPVPGTPPLLVDLPDACPFAARCPVAEDSCRAAEPTLLTVDTDDSGGAHTVACRRAPEIDDGAIDGRPIYPLPPIPENRAIAVPREERSKVLELSGVTKTFPLTKGGLLKRKVGTVFAVNGIDLDIREGETLGLVGESGCGKTTTLLEIMGLKPPEQGSIAVCGHDTAELKRKQDISSVRRNIQMMFQDPMGALDPRMTVFDILAEPLRAVGERDKQVLSTHVAELMELVGLDPEHRDRFPGAFSGGQRQRIGIARALATKPQLLVLDEPVSALDVSVQAGVINLLNELKAELGLSYLLVAHDLSVVRHISDRVAVMYLGRIVEIGTTDSLFDDPRHPYTKALLSAIPLPDPVAERSRERVLLKGDLPSPTDDQPGCRFVTRCPLHLTLSEPQKEQCRGATPELTARGDTDHRDACHFADTTASVDK
ncbi:Glutathione import ATP-binding protein GsiA [Streptomyces sp. YIM 130001]|uniref:ABC transporter ATP-binding protein n=1 Tax=Streptomyces sp. YIM 130001 TaxID=2259644 RepID=UPI000E6491E7|nr:ABC transporter ATP-binding protein [Streptomyces sp. YIM 130001]RII20513.1 Glutathione import ATP-binding protein GsiA [Streptomyces sp. YIM 130001]